MHNEPILAFFVIVMRSLDSKYRFKNCLSEVNTLLKHLTWFRSLFFQIQLNCCFQGDPVAKETKEPMIVCDDLYTQGMTVIQNGGVKYVDPTEGYVFVPPTDIIFLYTLR